MTTAIVGDKGSANGTGTKQWATQTLAIDDGCINDCLYCWARDDKTCRFKNFYRKRGLSDWRKPVTHQSSVAKILKRKKPYGGRIMFPSCHDITDQNAADCIKVLVHLCELGSEVLIVSKPRMTVVQRLVKALARWKDQITFRFSITCDDQTILDFWEPGAPSYKERMRCLKHVHDAGWRVGVSSEPVLDPDHLSRHIGKLVPYVSDTIYIGPMGRLPKNVDIEQDWSAIAHSRTQAGMLAMYDLFKGHPKISFKEKIQKAVAKRKERQT